MMDGLSWVSQALKCPGNEAEPGMMLLQHSSRSCAWMRLWNDVQLWNAIWASV